MAPYRIAVVAGDGIGPEVVAEALKVLRAVADGRLALDFQEVEAGAGCYRRTGEDLPRETLEVCEAADAILFGSAGLPDVRFAASSPPKEPRRTSRARESPTRWRRSSPRASCWTGWADTTATTTRAPAARRLEAAVAAVLAARGPLTPDVGGEAGTATVGDAVAARL